MSNKDKKLKYDFQLYFFTLTYKFHEFSECSDITCVLEGAWCLCVRVKSACRCERPPRRFFMLGWTISCASTCNLSLHLYLCYFACNLWQSFRRFHSTLSHSRTPLDYRFLIHLPQVYITYVNDPLEATCVLVPGLLLSTSYGLVI